jgi:serine/threonine-protein kinase
MGAVWKATHLALKKSVAIKTLRSPYTRSEVARGRFLREGEAASRIRHPNVVEIHDVRVLDDEVYMVMEYLEGEPLSARLQREARVPLRDLADLVIPVCAAVAVAHDRGVVHRDLKPENIFLARAHDGTTQPKVLDFGISRVSSDDPSRNPTATAALLGTPRYMAPEQARGDNRLVTERCDQYALGVILYQGATGALPIAETALYDLLHRVIHGQFAPPSALRPDLPPEFERIILRAMATRADERFPSMRALGAALLPFASARTRVLHGPGLESDTSATLDTSVTIPVTPVVTTLGAAVAEIAPTAPMTASPPVSAGPPRRRVGLLVGAALALGVAAVSLGVSSRPRPERSASGSTRASPPRIEARALGISAPIPVVAVDAGVRAVAVPVVVADAGVAQRAGIASASPSRVRRPSTPRRDAGSRISAGEIE